MRYTKKKDYQGTIRKVWNDDKTACYGVVGLVDDLLAAGVLDYIDGVDAREWMFIPVSNPNGGAVFGETRNEAVTEALGEC